MKIPESKQEGKFHGKKRSNQRGLDGSSLPSSECPFTILGISKNGASRKEVLRAWRRKMKVSHSDKTGDGDDTAAKVLNDAKERALKDVTDKSLGPGDKAQQEFEEASGIQVGEDRMEQLHRILTGQTALRDGSTQAEQSDITEKWMDKDAFKKDIFEMMSYGLGRY
jgi:curved DNA-binding protein CbpA